LTNVQLFFIILVNIQGEVLGNTSCESHLERLSEKVKELRSKKGWAQDDMAREIGVSLSTVQRWERQGGNPTRLARRELSRLFEEAGIDDG
jgi:DNA-binding transcriptional regulator YiaG